MVERSDLVLGLEAVQRRICSYGGGGRCDCKFGAHRPGAHAMSENGCGCPEVGRAAEILAAMTPAEYERVLRRMGRPKRAVSKLERQPDPCDDAACPARPPTSST